MLTKAEEAGCQVVLLDPRRAPLVPDVPVLRNAHALSMLAEGLALLEPETGLGREARNSIQSRASGTAPSAALAKSIVCRRAGLDVAH
jgi:hypothetical protein